MCLSAVLVKLAMAWGLMSACVVIHAVGIAATLQWTRRHIARTRALWPSSRLFIRLAGVVVLLHLLEIAVWAFFYVWQDAMPDVQSALYFSGVTYTTTGYGDLVLPPEWRLVSAVEALTGILMCGWSTAFFIGVVTRSLETKRAAVTPRAELRGRLGQ